MNKYATVIKLEHKQGKSLENLFLEPLGFLLFRKMVAPLSKRDFLAFVYLLSSIVTEVGPH